MFNSFDSLPKIATDLIIGGEPYMVSGDPAIILHFFIRVGDYRIRHTAECYLECIDYCCELESKSLANGVVDVISSPKFKDDVKEFINDSSSNIDYSEGVMFELLKFGLLKEASKLFSNPITPPPELLLPNASVG